METFGFKMDETESEAFVASFIAGLFLTHRRMASISQEGEDVANIMIEDLWPHLNGFVEVLEAVDEVMANDAEALDGQTTGSEHRMEAIAERARLAEEREARRQAKLEAKMAAEEALPSTPQEDVVQPATVNDSNSLSEHDWLVE